MITNFEDLWFGVCQVSERFIFERTVLGDSVSRFPRWIPTPVSSLFRVPLPPLVSFLQRLILSTHIRENKTCYKSKSHSVNFHFALN